MRLDVAEHARRRGRELPRGRGRRGGRHRDARRGRAARRGAATLEAHVPAAAGPRRSRRALERWLAQPRGDRAGGRATSAVDAPAVPGARLGGASSRPPSPARDRHAAAGRAALGRARRARARGARDRARHGVRHRPARDHAHLPRGARGGASTRGAVRSALDVGTGSGVLAAALARLGVPRGRRARHRRRACCRWRARTCDAQRRAGTSLLLGGGVAPCARASTSWSPTCSPTRSSPRRRALAARGRARRPAGRLGRARRAGRGRRGRVPGLARVARARRRAPGARCASSGRLMLRLFVPGARDRRRPGCASPARSCATCARCASGRATACACSTTRAASTTSSLDRVGAARGDRRRIVASDRPRARIAARPGARAGAAEGRQDGPGGREGDRARRAPHRARASPARVGGRGATSSAGGASRSPPPSSAAARRVPVDRRAGAARRRSSRQPWPGLRLVAWEGEPARRLGDAAGARRARSSSLVGPEGGFAADEVARRARARLRRRSTLGPRILRAETAAIVAAALCQHRWGDG